MQAKLDMKPHLDGVQGKLEAAKVKLHDVAEATDDKWDGIMKSADQTWNEVKAAVEGAYDALKPHKKN